MPSIAHTIHNLFYRSDHRAVFWYAEPGDASAREHVDEVQLDGVSKRELDRNSFALNYELRQAQAEDRFFVFSSRAKPADKDN